MDLASNCASGRGVFATNPAMGAAKALRRPRVLLLDDEESTSRTFVHLLRLSGFDAEFVLTGAEALSCALTAPPDAVILDLHLADDDIPGLVVLKSLRAKYPDLPIIAVTGWYLSDEDEAEARALGVTDYLFKPVDDAELVASLRLAVAGPVEQAYERLEYAAAAAECTASSEARRAAEATIGEGAGRELAAGENAFIGHRLPHLVRRIRRAFPTVWDDVITEQVEDTLLEFVAKLKRGVWPVRGSLDGHLRQAAWRNVRDQLQAAGRRRANEARYAREQAQLTQADEAGSSADLRTVLTLAQTDAEGEALRRWLDEESPLRIAEALGVSHLPTAGQLREVKRFKDRIKKRARRN